MSKGFFENKNKYPIDIEMLTWMENSFQWLLDQFGREHITGKRVLLPTPEDFPIKYDGTKVPLIRTAELLASQMDIDINDVTVNVYEDHMREFRTEFGGVIWTETSQKSNKPASSGLFFQKDSDGKYSILIEKRNLIDPERLVATLAHEFSHIKLLGENRVIENDEFLTDLTTVVFGLGIFNANAAFRERRSFEFYQWQSLGYLKQREWGYALALYAQARNESKPSWVKYLAKNIQSDFAKSMDYIIQRKSQG